MEDLKTEVKKKVAIVGNKTTELIIGNAAMKLSQATKSIEDALKTVTNINSIVEEGTLKVTNLETQIADLELKFKQDKSTKAFELDLEFKKNQEKYVVDYLANKRMLAVSQEEVDKTNQELTKLRGDFSKEVATEVHKATGSMASKHSSEIQILGLEHRNKEAENIATIKQLQEQNKFLTEQVVSWKTALDSERTAGVERAKAASIGTMNVGTSK